MSKLSLLGLGDSGTTLPEHYLVPMTRLEIDAYVFSHTYELCSSCTEWPQAPCCHVFMEIEKNNLLFVNGFITYDQLTKAYREAADAMAHIPRIPGFKEQLKNSGTFLVGAVSGFFAAGPVGMFAGAASAITKIVSDERKRMASKINTVLSPNIQKAQEADIARKEQKTLGYTILGASTLAVAGILYLILSD